MAGILTAMPDNGPKLHSVNQIGGFISVNIMQTKNEVEHEQR